MPQLAEFADTTPREAVSRESSTSSASSPTESRGEFMRRAYELNGEPLRLLEGGQRWFRHVLAHEYSPQANASALVLGATPWLTRIIWRTVAQTTIVDASSAMLAMCESSMRPPASRATNEATFVRGNWLELPESLRGLDLVAGDNSFSFLRYPDEWDEMLDVLADRTIDDSVLFARLLSVPASHRRLCPAEIVRHARARHSPVNFTAVRVALLFAHWDATDYTIRPEEALATFEACRREFDPILCEAPDSATNDLLSIEKYRGTGATYFVPPLAEALDRFARRFHVRAVQFGPYEMSQYFPLLVASREDT
jgi:hypothetical protein